MTKVSSLIKWLQEAPADASVGIDDGGLCLVIVVDGKPTLDYAEIGGTPEDESAQNVPLPND